MKKLILIVVVALIALSAYYFLPEKIEGLVLEELESQGQRVFGTQVEVSDLAIDVKNGTASINQISIANPPEYSQPLAMTLSSITARFNYKSGVIEEIIVADPHVFAQFRGKDLNILDLANHAEKVRKGNSQAGKSQEVVSQTIDETTEPSDDEYRAVTISLVALDNTTVDIQSDLTEQQKQFSIERLEARDLHGDSGQLANQLVKGLFNDLAKQVISESAKTLEDEALEMLKDQAKEKLKKLFD